MHGLIGKSGVEITKYFGFSFGNVPKRSTCPALFLPVMDRQADGKLKDFNLSFGKVSKIFTCPALFLPVPVLRLYFYLSRTGTQSVISIPVNK